MKRKTCSDNTVLPVKKILLIVVLQDACMN